MIFSDINKLGEEKSYEGAKESLLVVKSFNDSQTNTNLERLEYMNSVNNLRPSNFEIKNF